MNNKLITMNIIITSNNKKEKKRKEKKRKGNAQDYHISSNIVLVNKISSQ